MARQSQKINQGEIIIYKAPHGPEIQVILKKDTVWLDAHLIAKVFNVKRPAIVKHVNNIYKSGELGKKSTCSILEQVAADGKIRKMNLYNLDMIISVGYRVNSARATQFRIWATTTLKQYLVKGYTINEKRLHQSQNQMRELQSAIELLRVKSAHELMAGQQEEILNLIADYSKTFTLLEEYDKEKLALIKETKAKFVLEYEQVKVVICEIKRMLTGKRQAGDLFGQESGGRLKAIVGNIYQTFEKKELYPSLEEKAAHLFYFVIKDHPLVDGNKRIASFLFIYFLDKNGYFYKKNGEKKINDNALTVLALLIAISEPREKDKLVKIITNLLKE